MNRAQYHAECALRQEAWGFPGNAEWHVRQMMIALDLERPVYGRDLVAGNEAVLVQEVQEVG